MNTERMRARLDAARPTTDEEFALLGSQAGLLTGLTGEPLPRALEAYVREHADPDELLVLGLREIEHAFLEAVCDALPIVMLQKWSLLATAVDKVRRLSPRVWTYLGTLEREATRFWLSDYAAEDLERWRENVGLDPELQIAAVATIISGDDKELIDALRA